MIDVSYENLFRTIYPTLPDGWQKVIIHAAFIDDSCSLKYYIKQGDGAYCDCFGIDYDQIKILEVIASLHHAGGGLSIKSISLSFKISSVKYILASLL